MRYRQVSARSASVLFLSFLSLLQPAQMVKHENFKTCSQSGFCKRNRALADRAHAAGASWTAPYELDEKTLQLKDGVLTGKIWKTEAEAGAIELPLQVSLFENGVARVTIDEARRRTGEITLRHDSKARKERYNEAEKWALVGDHKCQKTAAVETKEGVTIIVYGPDGYEARITHKPFSVQFLKRGEVYVVFNDRNLINVEHWRPKIEKAEGEELTEDEETYWEETFGGNTDSKPRGPESVALDITFPGYDHVYGIPEHATSLSLKETRGGEGNYNEPYRLYNSDVFEYETDSPMTLYGSIPFMQAQKKGSSVGVFWLSAAETWVDVIKTKQNPHALTTEKASTQTHWISESGLLDVFVLPGPDAASVYRQYGELTGFTALPTMFSIAYHQCRWNYVSQDDVKDVDRKFDKFDIPYDVAWLDIEHTDGKRYFTWDPLTFNKPESMQKTLAKRDRKLVVIVDPHIKNDESYTVNKEMVEKGFGVKDKGGDKVYEGWCWPGSSHWVDCFNPAAVNWWKSLFKFDKFVGSTPNLWIWNDMNEPSVFNGPETTMPKDNIHHGGWEHRDVHNINGMSFHNATYEGLRIRLGNGKERRPFVLTRSFFAGSQRSAAMWTGDNQADWPHLQQAFPMLLANGVAGFPFAGADVGGFFGNPSKELLTRWYQAGAFYPFFRGHAHIDAKRREPYLAGEPYVSIIRDAIRLRYALLPAWYTAFHRASWEGMPILRPHFVAFPDDEAGFAIDDQFFLGDTGLLAKPVVKESATETTVYFPDDQVYYDYFDFTTYHRKGNYEVPAALEKIPLFMRGGHIIPRKDRPRRSSGLMRYDPYTLVISVSNEGAAGGDLYVDDGETYAHRSGAYIHRAFTFKDNTLHSTNLHPEPAKAAAYSKDMKSVRVERIVVVGVGEEWAKKKEVEVKQGSKTWKAKVIYTEGKGGKANTAVVRNPKARITKDWSISFT